MSKGLLAHRDEGPAGIAEPRPGPASAAIRAAFSQAVAGVGAGAVAAAAENVAARATGLNVPASLLLLNVSVLTIGSALVAALLGLLGPRARSGFPAPSLAIAGLALGYAWLFPRSIQAAEFRGAPGSLGPASLTAVLFVGWALLRARRGAPEGAVVPLPLGATIVGIALVADRFVAKNLVGSYFRGPSLAAHVGIVVLAAGLAWLVGRRAPTRASLRGCAPWAASAALAALASAIVPAEAPALDGTGVRPAPRSQGRPNVLLVTIDTLRADRVSALGYSRRTTPRLEAFASDAMVFTDAVSPSSWTLPAHASLFTGLLPSHHGASFLERADPRAAHAHPLGTSHPTLAGLLGAAGYRTRAVVANAAYLNRGLGVARGFEEYDDRAGRAFGYSLLALDWLRESPLLFDAARKPYRSAAQISTTASAALRSLGGGPFFLFVNYMDAHEPTSPPAPYDRMFGARRFFVASPVDDVLGGKRSVFPHEKEHYDARYDGAVAYADQALGDLFEDVRRLGLYDDTLIVVTSDHGEFLGEHDLWGHAVGPFEQVHRVPLLIKFPGSRLRGTRANRVQLQDVFATVLKEVGLPIPPGVDSDVLPEVSHPIVVEQRPNPTLASLYGGRLAAGYQGIYRAGWKFVRYTDGRTSLFDLDRDPGETTDVVAEHVEEAAEFSRALASAIRTGPERPSEAPSLDPEALRNLRSLGYVR